MHDMIKILSAALVCVPACNRDPVSGVIGA
jgi:hypothetical protein